MLYRVRKTGERENTLQKNQSKFLRDPAGKIIDSVLSDPSEPVSIDLEKALKNKDSKYDLVLQEGDIIYVPEVNSVVSVKGEVQSQLKIFFDKEHTKLGYYIDKAGVLGVRPWRKRIYVTYANGRSKRTHNFGFFHFYPKVEAGSIIVVPQKPEGKNFGEFASQVLLTSLPLLMAIIITRL